MQTLKTRNFRKTGHNNGQTFKIVGFFNQEDLYCDDAVTSEKVNP